MIQPINIHWFPSSEQVFAVLRRMMHDGWVPSQEHRGLVHGGYVVRPVRTTPSNSYTGVALFNLKEKDHE